MKENRTKHTAFMNSSLIALIDVASISSIRRIVWLDEELYHF